MNTMWMPTATAITGSSQPHAGCTITTRRPPITPAEVHTSVIRWCASASIVMLSCWCATRSITRAVAKFIAPASTATTMPGPRCSSGWGDMKRCAADQMIDAAATRISVPSTPLEKYSALSWP